MILSKKALDALIKEYLLIGGKIFCVQCLHTGHSILSVQKLIFALAHLVKGQKLHTRKSNLAQKRSDSLRIRQVRVEIRDHGDPGQNRETLFICPPEVPVDQICPDAGSFPVLFCIMVLDVKEQEVKD